MLLGALVLVALLVRTPLRQNGPSPHARLFETLWRTLSIDGEDHKSPTAHSKRPTLGCMDIDVVSRLP